MVRSNTITIHVKTKVPEKPEIVNVSLNANKTSIYEGETIRFDYIIHFNKSITSEQANTYKAKITVLVNNVEQKTFFESLVPGTDYIAGDYTLVFTKAGDYTVAIDADIVRK